MAIRPVRQPKRAVRPVGQRGDTADAIGPRHGGAVFDQRAIFQRHGQRRAGRCDGADRRGMCLHLFRRRAGPQPEKTPASTGQYPAGMPAQVVCARQRGEDSRIIQPRIGAERAVERRDRDGTAAKDVKDRIKDHDRFPQ
ncbi:MAG: hypothetical protein R3D87_03310 [Paracoccaceae bacterium]